MGEPAEKSIGCSSFLTFLSSMVFYGLQVVAMVLGENGGIIFLIVAMLYGFASLIPSLAVAVRRMHDVGKDWWYIFIPIYNLILCCTEGERRENQYGPDPKAGE
jgi:hypothetical protein